MVPDEWTSKITDLWRRSPEQVRRLSIALIVIVIVFVPVRRLLVPRDFGRYGHYRASALEEAAALPAVYAGHAVCNDCHDDVVALKHQGYHANTNCETCHGPALAHTENPDSIIPPAPRDREYCVLCHEYLSSRPTGFPQIVSESHHPLKPCIECHNPHDPTAHDTEPTECTACHAAIARSKEASHHVYLQCARCHTAPDEHRTSPREHRVSKPASRELCGECHAIEAQDSTDAPRVNLATHGEQYVCWQCHYPHNPEAR